MTLASGLKVRRIALRIFGLILRSLAVSLTPAYTNRSRDRFLVCSTRSR